MTERVLCTRTRRQENPPICEVTSGSLSWDGLVKGKRKETGGLQPPCPAGLVSSHVGNSSWLLHNLPPKAALCALLGPLLGDSH